MRCRVSRQLRTPECRPWQTGRMSHRRLNRRLYLRSFHGTISGRGNRLQTSPTWSGVSSRCSQGDVRLNRWRSLTNLERHLFPRPVLR